ncbi:MAG: tetratricopeptide repeat protein [Acidobacteriota bacterium]
MSRRWLLIVLGLVGWTMTTPVSALPRSDEPWHRLRGEHFEIVSNAPPAQILSTAKELDGLRHAISRVTAFEPVSPVPIRLYLFDDDISLHPYKHRFDGKPADMSGAYYPRPWGDFLTMNGARRRSAQRSVFHEYLHAVLRNNLPGLPLWLEEGMAEFFSTFVVVGDTGRLGRPVPWHPYTLGSGDRLDLRVLLTLETDSDHYNRFEHQGELYARSWELAHYFLLDIDRRRQLLDYLGRTFAGAEPAEAFRAAFDTDFLTMEERLLAYRRGGYPERRVPLDTRPSTIDGNQIERMAHDDVLTALGDLLVAQGKRRAEATFHFESVLDRSPDHAGALTGLGQLAELDGDLPRARALYHRAAEGQPDDPRASYHYAKSLLQLGRATQEAKLAEARHHLERSVTADPTFAPAWIELTRARALTESPTTGPSLPASGQIALQLLLLHSRHGDRDAARALWHEVFERRPDDPLRRSAQAVLERMDWVAAERSTPPELVRPDPAHRERVTPDRPDDR